MDKVATLALFAQGKAARNAWAIAMIGRHAAIVAAGKWHFSIDRQDRGEVVPENEETKTWMSDRVAQFAQHEFAEPPDFSGFVFPGKALFMSAEFRAGGRFAHARFNHGAIFNGAAFGGPADFSDANFASEGEFLIVKFAAEARFSGSRFGPGIVEPNMAGYCWFGDARFDASALFDRVRFHGNTLFDNAEFAAEAVFTGAEFRRFFSFTGTRFDGPARFHGASFPEPPNFAAASFAQALER